MHVKELRKEKILNLEVTTATALIDEAVAIKISNLASHDIVTIEASCKDQNNNIWTSQATFRADENGMVNVAAQAPLAGSYQGIDPMGLFWSMTSSNKEYPIFEANKEKDDLDVLLSVSYQDKLRLQKTLCRLLVSPNVKRRSIKERGMVGTLFYPKNMHKGPGVIILPGSNGGIPERSAKLLASHGYAVLALGYFGLEGLPETLENIHLEYFQQVMKWFKEQPQVDAGRLALLGHSLGGELGLLLAATFPGDMAAVVAGVPAGIVYGAYPNLDKPCWFYKKVPLPCIPLYPCNDPNPSHEAVLQAVTAGKIPLHAGSFEDPFDYSAIFLWGMEVFSHNIEAATVPVENITCPLLLLSGEDDKVWPSALYGNLIMERLAKKQSPIKREHLHFAHAGHALLFPYPPYMPVISQPIFYPPGKIWTSFGGTAEGNAYATRESWFVMLNFLKEALSVSK